MNSCDIFRRALAAMLLRDPSSSDLTALGWHEHLLGCEACRILLEQEEALELLLSSLPEPELPAELAGRVLARLRGGSMGRGLDRLLDLDEVLVPEGLSLRIRDGLEVQGAGAKLDQLLDLAGEVRLSPGLSGRVLEGLAGERGALTSPGRQLVTGQWRAAAAVVLVLGGAFWISTRGGGGGEGLVRPHPDDAVIAWLPALEYWEEVRQLDPLEAELAMKFDHIDAALLEEGG